MVNYIVIDKTMMITKASVAIKVITSIIKEEQMIITIIMEEEHKDQITDFINSKFIDSEKKEVVHQVEIKVPKVR